MSSTYASCSGAVEAAFAAVMRSAVRWAVDGEELRLDRPDGRGLRFRVRDSIYPTRELLRGQRGGGGYQFGWQAGSGLVSLRWAWRDGPGKPWGRRDEPQADPDGAAAGPAGGAAGTDWFVFGVVPRATARVLCRPPGGRPAVALGCSPSRARGRGVPSAGSSTRPRARSSSPSTSTGASWTDPTPGPDQASAADQRGCERWSLPCSLWLFTVMRAIFTLAYPVSNPTGSDGDLYSHVTATMQQEAVRAFEGLLGSQLGSQPDSSQATPQPAPVAQPDRAADF
jgi:hypothetical protein